MFQPVIEALRGAAAQAGDAPAIADEALRYGGANPGADPGDKGMARL
jgi:hypothetical protein